MSPTTRWPIMPINYYVNVHELEFLVNWDWFFSSTSEDEYDLMMCGESLNGSLVQSGFWIVNHTADRGAAVVRAVINYMPSLCAADISGWHCWYVAPHIPILRLIRHSLTRHIIPSYAHLKPRQSKWKTYPTSTMASYGLVSTQLMSVSNLQANPISHQDFCYVLIVSQNYHCISFLLVSNQAHAATQFD